MQVTQDELLGLLHYVRDGTVVWEPSVVVDPADHPVVPPDAAFRDVKDSTVTSWYCSSPPIEPLPEETGFVIDSHPDRLDEPVASAADVEVDVTGRGVGSREDTSTETDRPRTAVDEDEQAAGAEEEEGEGDGDGDAAAGDGESIPRDSDSDESDADTASTVSETEARQREEEAEWRALFRRVPPPDETSQTTPHEGTEAPAERTMAGSEARPPRRPPSELRRAVEDAAKGRGGGGFAASFSVSARLPDGKKINIKVPERATCRDLIRALVHVTNTVPVLTAMVPGEGMYAVHDVDDGEASDVAMGMEAPLKNFGTEFCVFPIAAEAVAAASGSATLSQNTLETIQQVERERSGQRVMQVAHGTARRAHRVAADGTFEALLAEVAKKDRLPAGVEYVFRLSDEDRSRLQLLRSDIAPSERLASFPGVSKVTLTEKVYRDTPTPRPRKAHLASSGARPSGASAPVVGLPTRLYQEWEVVKTNSRGKRQNRVLGMDHYKLYNSLLGGNTPFRKVARPERPMSEVLGAIHRGDARFAIVFEGQVVEYEAKTAEDAAEIVAKLQSFVPHHRKRG